MKMLRFSDSNTFKSYLKTSAKNDFLLDLSEMNIFDCLKFIVTSSVYFSQKYPKMKLKCHVISEDTKELISKFKVENLEFV